MLVCPRLALFVSVSLCMLSLPFGYLFCLSVGLFFVCSMYMLGARMLRVRVRPPKYEQKRQGCKQEYVNQNRAMFIRLEGLASPLSHFFRDLH